MVGKTVILQIVNLYFQVMPLIRWYRLKVIFLNFAGINWKHTIRLVSCARIVTPNVIIGDDTSIGHQVLISGNEKFTIRIGNNVDLAPRVCILSGSHLIDLIGDHSAGPGSGGNIVIEDGVWVGANSTILPGVRIGKKSIIGAGSVVAKDIPPYCIAVGNPCKPIKFWNVEFGSFEPVA